MNGSHHHPVSIGRRAVVSWMGAGGLLAALGPRAAFAQAAAVRPLIAFLVPQTKEGFADNVNMFLAGLKDLGYADGQNLTIEYRYADGALDRYGPLAAELVKLGPTAIITGSAASVRASEATPTIPIVVGNLTPGSVGLTQLIGPDPAHPLVANVTGFGNADVGPIRQFELMKELMPSITQSGVMLSTDAIDGGASVRARVEAGAAANGIKLVYAEMKSADGIEPAFRSLVAQRVPAILYADAALFSSNAPKVAALAADARIPCVYYARSFVAAGGLVSLGADSSAGFRRAASYVDRLIKGAKMGELPFQQLDAQVLSVNLTTAKALGLTIPPAVLARATEKIG